MSESHSSSGHPSPIEIEIIVPLQSARAYPQNGAKMRSRLEGNVKLGPHAALRALAETVKPSSTVPAAPRPAVRFGES